MRLTRRNNQLQRLMTDGRQQTRATEVRAGLQKKNSEVHSKIIAHIVNQERRRKGGQT